MTWKTSLDEADKYDLVETYLEGAGVVELARKFRIRTAAVNAILQEGCVPRRKTLTAATPIERRLHDALVANGVGFTTQRRLVARYVVDIAINQAPVVIEADGARHQGAVALGRDAKRDAAHEAAGYRVYRFSGSEINADAMVCIQRVIRECGLVPDEKPVYDVRTRFSGPDHPRWADRFVAVTCEYCGETFETRSDRKARFCSPRHYNLHCRETGILKGKKRTPEQRARIAAANRARARPLSDETRAKISSARQGIPSPAKGKPMTAEQKAKISATLTGHKDSDETRAKKAAARTGRSQSPQTRARIAAALAGKPKSAEHRAQLSAAMRANQTKIESDLTRERESSAETTLPAAG